MNHCVHDWSMEDETRTFSHLLPVSNQKKSMGPDQDLAELLWRNGQVVLNCQTHRRPILSSNESKQLNKTQQPCKGGVSLGNSSNLVQEDETASWLQYPLEEALEKDFCSEFFYDMPVDSIAPDKPTKEASTEGNAMPPPKLQVPDSVPQTTNMGLGRVRNFPHFSRPIRTDFGSSNQQFEEKGSGNVIQEAGGSSTMTIGLSHCGSNKVQNDDISRASSNGVAATNNFSGTVKKDVQKMFFQIERGQTDTLELTVTSSSGGSGGSMGRTGKQTASNQSHKRKVRDAEESDCQSEEAEYESFETNKPAQKSASARRSRAAEVHNLSERRRRDRINEKMKALQELIPHCNKSDKASMLDEAIEYLKSLQLQVQIMWMGSGMTPMMFPGVQHYMPQMGMGMSQSPLPSLHGSVQLPRVPLVDQAVGPPPMPNQPPMCPPPVLNVVNFQNQMQNANLPESYSRYLGFHPMQMPPQAMNLFTYGSQAMHSQRPPPPNSSSGAVPLENIQNGNLG